MVRKSQKPNLKLNLSPADAAAVNSLARGYSSSPSSCLSSQEGEAEVTPMVVAGCQRCLMYIMLAVDDLRCPKCGSLVLVHFFHGPTSSEEKKNKSG
ncbi:protein GL2-INTERACTING REPRESSOR 2-like [Zingiber officinale]|uniref:protein GL2-INTERACTING REPRESSOR 2-like n=1 Tax=Zingiber officinale TaxID=94328 RepID=UPI001C4CC3B0|nr:protein GL2-INTERACTING REPRESSOR 2-like [Zingiber officinale]